MARAIDSEAAYRFLSEQLVKETGAFSKGVNKGLNIARSAMRNPDTIPTLTPPNEWVNRVRELDELYTKLQIVTGFTAEQLLEIFAAGYTLEKPDYSKKFAEMENLAEAAQPNEPLTMEELREMKGQPVWTVTTGLDGSGRWELVCDVDYEDVLEMASCVDGFYAIEMDTYGSTWTAYRRPPEGEEET